MTSTEHTWQTHETGNVTCLECEADSSWCDNPPKDSHLYEYQAQWWYDGPSTWMPVGWRGITLWGTEQEADALINESESWPKDAKFRVIRRRKPGPVEVVREVDPQPVE